MDNIPAPMAAVFDVVMARATNPDATERVKREGQEAYEIRVMRALMSLGTTHEELWHLQALLRKAELFPEIRALLKLYVTSWATLSDIVAILINEVYDLGYAEQDIELGTILRNGHIRKTSIAKLVAQHRKAIEHERYAKLRNDVIHRGKLNDPELEELYSVWLSKAVLATYKVDAAKEGARDQVLALVAAEMGLHEKLYTFIEKRAESLANHLRATRVLLEDVGHVLAARMNQQPTA